MSFFDRFHHPRLAMMTALVFAIWIVGSLVAGTGVAFGNLMTQFYGAVIALLGILIFAFCILWFLSLYVVRYFRTQTSRQ